MAALLLAVLPACSSQGGVVRSPAPWVTQMGLFVPSQQPGDVAALARHLHLRVEGLSAYTARTSWRGIARYVPPPTSLRLFLSVSMNPAGARPAQVPGHLAVFRALAATLVRRGHADAIIRIGWEWSATYFPWGTQSTTPAQYVTAFRAIVTAMRDVAGARFGFDWCANSGSVPSDGSYAASYPGNAYVDYIGTDQYDSPRSSWVDDLDGTGGLAYTAAFARAHHKPMSIPEWGLYGQDDPSFIDLMHGFITNPANHVAYDSYFADDAPVDTDITSFPASEAAFVRDFG